MSSHLSQLEQRTNTLRDATTNLTLSFIQLYFYIKRHNLATPNALKDMVILDLLFQPSLSILAPSEDEINDYDDDNLSSLALKLSMAAIKIGDTCGDTCGDGGASGD